VTAEEAGEAIRLVLNLVALALVIEHMLLPTLWDYWREKRKWRVEP
jgi:hypothetical protein